MKHFTKIIPVVILLLVCSKPEKEQHTTDIQSLSWPLYRGDPRLSGVASGRLPNNPKLLWTFQTGDDIKSSPVIGCGFLYIGSTDGKLYALNVTTGDSIWAFDTGDDIEAPPLLLDSTIYIGSLSGEFYAIDALTGQKRWSFLTDDEIYGSANWVFAPNGVDKRILVGSYDFNIYCFDAKTGEKQWTYATNNYINGAPATDGDVVIFGGCDEQLHIVSVADGTQIGQVDAGSYIAGSAALLDDHAYLGHYGDKLIAIDLIAQKILWEYDNDGTAGSFFASPAVDEQHVVIGSRDKLVHCVDRKNGQKLWTFQTRDDVDCSPVICDNKVIVASNDGRLYLINLTTGQLIWSYEIGADIVGSPAVTQGFIFVGAGDGCVYAFGESL
ncbi:PQQ-binding-like beta-propeller repeat protein [candidate division KSB1 bacterium]|nr:PQQ-binding-like beta-propeller repeat protein [candidate division KSB1 bacterium]